MNSGKERRHPREAVTAEMVREFLAYEPSTGALTWRARAQSWFATDRAHAIWNARFAGKPAGHLNDIGYMQVRILYHSFYTHRLIWALMTGAWPPEEVDHIDHDRANNVWSNLRLAGPLENRKNQTRRRNNTSGITGVSWHPTTGDSRAGKWMVRVGKEYIGIFEDLAEATAICKAEQEARGFHENHGTSQ